MKYYFYLLILIISCKGNIETVDVSREEVMKIHDDAMARMGEISNAVSELSELSKYNADSIKIRALIQDVESAEEGMMVWMEQYKQPDSDLEVFYAKEKDKIEVVANDINKSLENAKKFMD